ncbi:hypothetical protein [Pantanalinema sp. GBBB05]|uniref:hypothetical protein n=1 Tax=Pantanalinema sp. GBBB05 TaxID=2604139 RepID=UPI003D814E5B
MINDDELNALTTALEEFADRMTPPLQYVATYTQVEQPPLPLLVEKVEADESAD